MNQYADQSDNQTLEMQYEYTTLNSYMMIKYFEISNDAKN